MFGGIGGLGQLAGLMGKLPKIQEEFGKFRDRLDSFAAEGQAGGGMVTVRVNGKMVVQSVRLTDEAITDRELLEDLIRAATNQALDRMKETLRDESQRVAAEIGLPPGFNIPGLS